MEMTPTDYGGMNDEQPIDPNKGFENPLYDSAHQVGTACIITQHTIYREIKHFMLFFKTISVKASLNQFQ